MIESLSGWLRRRLSASRSRVQRAKVHAATRRVPKVERVEDRIVLSPLLELRPYDGDRPEIEIQFSEAMDPVSAGETANYRIIAPNGLEVPIDTGVYDAANHRAKLGLNGGARLGEGTYQPYYRGSLQNLTPTFLATGRGNLPALLPRQCDSDFGA